MQIRSLLAMGAAIALAACGSNKSPTQPNDATQSTFSATISGASQTNLTGTAAFGQNQQGLAFGLALSDTTHKGGIVFARDSGQTTLGTGSYSLADGTTGKIPNGAIVAVAWIGSPSSPSSFFVSKSGTLTITDQSSTSLKGSFQFTGMGATMGDTTESTVTVSGTFTAVGGTVSVPSGSIRIRSTPLRM